MTTERKAAARPPEIEFRLVGSRATGRARPDSDWDIAVYGTPEIPTAPIVDAARHRYQIAEDAEIDLFVVFRQTLAHCHGTVCRECGHVMRAPGVADHPCPAHGNRSRWWGDEWDEPCTPHWRVEHTSGYCIAIGTTREAAETKAADYLEESRW